MMKHYNLEDWKLYEQELLPKKEYDLMETHLLECSHCSTLYLFLLEETTSRMILPSLSSDFTATVLQKIHHEKQKCTAKKKKLQLKTLLTYYISAASITLFLVHFGAFEFIYKNLSYAVGMTTTKIEIKTERAFITGWTDTCTEKTSTFLSFFTPR